MKRPNLLPIEYRKTYQVYLVQIFMRNFLVFNLGLFAVLAAGLFVSNIFYKTRLDNLQSNQANLASVQSHIDMAELKTLAADQNDKLKAASAILKVRPALSKALVDFSGRIPVGVTLDSLLLDTNGTSLTAKGRAATRDEVVQFQNNLEQSKLLRVSFAPLSNLTESQDAKFEFILKFDIKNFSQGE